MASSDATLAVGSQNDISFIDPRQQLPVSSVSNVDHNHGEQHWTQDIQSLQTSSRNLRLSMESR